MRSQNAVQALLTESILDARVDRLAVARLAQREYLRRVWDQ